MPVAVQEVEKLGLKRRARAVGVEVGEERVFGFFQNDRRVETSAEPLGQRRFSRADRTLDRDVPELQSGADDIIATVFSRASAS